MSKKGSSLPPIPRVPEYLLKKHRVTDKQVKLLAKLQERQNKARLHRKGEYVKRAKAYDDEYSATIKDIVAKRKAAFKAGKFYVNPEEKLAFVVRIRGINGMHPRTRKILQLFRLRQIHNGVFLKLNKATLNMLRLVEPYVAWGYPTVGTIKKLIKKRGFGKVNGRRTALYDNEVIEKCLSRCGVICLDDIIHQIATVGPYFREVNRFLWPFKLSSPRGGYIKKGNHFIEGGDYGNRELYINTLIKRMN